MLESKVRRYFPWQFGVDYDEVGKGSGQDVWDEQLDVRQLLRSQDITEWVIVSTGMFTSYLFEPSFGVVDMANKTVFALGDWDNAVTLTTPEDIGLLTTEIFFTEPTIVNQVVYVAGDTITYMQLADMLESISGQNIRREKLSLARLKSDVLVSHGETASKYRLAFARKTGVSWDMNKTFNAQKGLKVKSVPQWLRENPAYLPVLQHEINA